MNRPATRSCRLIGIRHLEEGYEHMFTHYTARWGGDLIEDNGRFRSNKR